ncbi:hypothetical protein PRK78_004676 [Emydomyces testavorans]|uniref:AB hydrolase-1 domain-containing protein n=1 Tax=Emydomyces testavorans TaxID=2070801 RepID=A0AAF0DIH3_9EURO|nr:hypothetical protein PRK78_004676 [Emydomyces testavorans]
MTIPQPLQGLVSLPLAVFETIYGYTSEFLLRFTLFRFFLLLLLTPLYMLRLVYSCWPYIKGNYRHLFNAKGRERLAEKAEAFREDETWLAQQQLEGTYSFEERQIFRVQRNGQGWMGDMPWAAEEETGEFTVCNATVRFVFVREAKRGPQGENLPAKPAIVFLHGNPSWSYMWREIIPRLAGLGHRVYAIDWLGHGRSDKVLEEDSITVELHMRTLMAFVDHVKLKNATFVAHDWGGCIALCTIPYLPATACSRLFLLNSFAPPRADEISLHYALLYAIWYLSTAIFNGYLPESAIMRYMVPHMSQHDVDAYSAPYTGLPAAAKSNISRLSHSAPGTPQLVLRQLRTLYAWKVIEGLCGPINFSDLNAQAHLSARDETTRSFWQRKERSRIEEKRERGFKTLVVFGARDPLLKDYKDVLVRMIDSRYAVEWAPEGVWVKDAGHYSMEDKPGEIVELVSRFAADS